MTFWEQQLLRPVPGGARSAPLDLGQETCYSIGDGGDYRGGKRQAYSVHTAGDFSGTVNLDCPHYAGTGLAFAATTPGTITDTGNGLVTFLTADTIVVKGSASNDGVYTISTGGVAGTIRTTEATLLEAAGAVMKLYKRAAISNNCVFDKRTRLMWARYTSDGLKHGIASDGKLNWYDAATCFELHAAGADLQMIAASHTLRIVGGAGEIAAFDVGDPIVCSGFTDADNNLPNCIIQSVTVNGSDLDLVLGPTDSNKLADLASEAAGGNRDIKLVCRSIFGYAAAANAVSLGGRTGWRNPNRFALANLHSLEAPTGVPDAATFPGWPAAYVWSSTGYTASPATRAYACHGSSAEAAQQVHVTANCAALVRG